MLDSTHHFRDRRNRRWYLLTLLAWLLAGGGAAFAQAQESFFEPVSAAQGRLAATARSIPNAKLYTLNEAGLRSALANTAKQDERGKAAARIAIPLPDGTTELFALRETQVMSPALAAANPTIKTYEGEGTVHKEYIIRMSLSSKGFEALIWGVDKDAVYFARTLTESGSNVYQSYYARDARKVGAVNSPAGDHHCGTIGTTDKPELPGLKQNGKGLRAAANGSQFSTGATIRIFRIAIATTGEWTRNAGNYAATPNNLATVRTNALAVIVSSVNRINGIYERELASRFTLVNPDTNGPDNIIFDDPATDPYDNTDNAKAPNDQLAINQTTLDNKVKSANYDVGHLFGTGGGGVAASPSLCATGAKAQGYSARGTDTGDPFVVDYFAHELGHQFGMGHTYNVIDPNGACTTRSAAEAYEVASGSTILSYVGICNDGRNLQQYNDFALPSFHISSITKATTYLVSEDVAGCGTTAGGANAIPTVSAGNSFVIPRLTPFTLTAAGADADAGDAPNLLYSWEEFDLAPANGATGFGGTPTGVYDIDDDGVPRPILRAYSPVASSQRTFPSTAFILNPQNNATPGENQPGFFYTGIHPAGAPGATCPTGQTCIIGERLPAIARTMNFRVSVRDRRGGVADAGTVVTVVNTPGAFRLTSFDNSSTVAGNSQQTVTWNVVGTNQAPVSCANVAIRLSTDGGLTFPTTLLASTPNDGSEVVAIPNVITSTARLRVEAVGNIFFDISNTNFTISNPIAPTVPIVKVNSEDPNATEGGSGGGGRQAAAGGRRAAEDPGFIQFERSSGQGTLVVNYAIEGTATNGVDFVILPTSVTFAEGQTVLIEEMDPLEDDIVEGDETIVITLLDSDDYDPDPDQLTTTLTIKDRATVSSAPFAITGVTTLSCEKITPTERRLTFAPQYTGLTGQPITFVVINEIEPTLAAAPYSIRVYIDNPTIRLKATQTGTPNDAQFTYNWLALCDVTTPPPTNVFAITAVTTVSCETVTATERRLTIMPQYTGLTGQPIKFVVVNEIEPTMAAGPYTLRMYIDNPTIRLRATQTGTPTDAVFVYDWLAACGTTPPTPEPVTPFAITGVTTLSCEKITPTERRLTFAPQYTGLTGQPIKFVVINEIEPTLAAAPYSIRVYIDNPTIRLKATQTGTPNDAQFTYNWLALCDVTTPPPTNVFAITAVTTVSCETVTATERRLTIMPQYTGLTGQPIKFVVVNEIEPTMAAGPYTLRMYIDNPTIRLRATQTGTPTDAVFVYDWLANCRTGTIISRPTKEGRDETSLSVRVLGNPIVNGRVHVEVAGAAGQPVQFMLTDMRGTVINTHRVEQPALVETHVIDVGRQPVGTLLLRVSTSTRSKTVTLLKKE